MTMEGARLSLKLLNKQSIAKAMLEKYGIWAVIKILWDIIKNISLVEMNQAIYIFLVVIEYINSIY